MKDELYSVHAMRDRRNNPQDILPTPPPPSPGWDLEHMGHLLLPSSDLCSAPVVAISRSSLHGLVKDGIGSGQFP